MTASAEQQRLRRDIGWNLAPIVLLGAVGLGLNFLIGGWWGAEALGAFNLVTIAFFTFAVVGACGLQYAVLRAVAEAPEDRDRVAAVVVGALVPCIVIAGLTAAAFVALRGPIGDLLNSERVTEGMLWAAPGLFCFAINKVLMCVVNGLRRMRAFAIYTSLRYLLIGAGLVIAQLWELDAEQLPVIWTFTEGVLLLVLVCELFATVAVVRGARQTGRDGWPTWSVRHLDFGVRGVTATLAYELNSKLDVWMLGVALPDAQVGIYSLASALYEGAMQLSVAVQNNLNPVIARDLALGEKASVEDLTRRTRRWFVPSIGAACLLGAAAYPVIIPWVIGDASFIGGAMPFAIMMGGIALASPYLPFNQMLMMAARPGWHTVYMLGIVTVNLVGTLVLIPIAGLEGAAASSATSVLASALLLRVLVRWRVGVRI